MPTESRNHHISFSRISVSIPSLSPFIVKLGGFVGALNGKAQINASDARYVVPSFDWVTVPANVVSRSFSAGDQFLHSFLPSEFSYSFQRNS